MVNPVLNQGFLKLIKYVHTNNQKNDRRQKC